LVKMPQLQPVIISRSDGVLSIVAGKSKVKEDNGPTSEQLQPSEATKGGYSWYQELPIGNAKNRDWRRKLGSMLMKHINTKSKANGIKAGESV
jgi:hypothetical protein